VKFLASNKIVLLLFKIDLKGILIGWDSLMLCETFFASLI